MADASFDVVSKVDRQEVDNALNQAGKELSQRFDFRGVNATIAWAGEEGVTLQADTEERVAAALDVFHAGGPTGDTVDDLQALVLAILHEEEIDAEGLARFDRLLHANPVLLGVMKRRFHRLAERVVAAVVQRSAGAVPARDAQLADFQHCH